MHQILLVTGRYTKDRPPRLERENRMLPKYCEHCRQLFVSQSGNGLTGIFCKACLHLCEDTYIQVRRYLEEKPGTLASRVSVELGVSGIFVYHLFRVGRFSTPDLSQRKTGDRQYCGHCRTTLKPGESSMCQPCTQVLTKRFQPQTPPLPTNSATVRDNTRRFGRHKHHGFGRSLN